MDLPNWFTPLLLLAIVALAAACAWSTLALRHSRCSMNEAAQNLIEHQALSQAIIERTPIGIVNLVDGRLASVNRTMLHIIGADTPEQVTGQHFSRFLVGDDLGRARQRVKDLSETPETSADFQPYRLLTLDEQVRDVELAAVSMPYAGSARITVFCVDRTDRHVAEAQIKQLNETLEQRVAERTAELEAFTTSVSHDLRAPARQVMSAADIMLRKLDQPGADLRPMLSALLTTAERMNRTIDALLELTRLGRAGLVPSWVDLNTLVAEVQSDLTPSLDGRVVEWHAEPLPTVHADPDLLRLVLVNLLDNALKFTRYVPLASIDIWADQLPGFAAVNVRDNGAGFDMNQVNKLFTLFTRLHSNRDFEGTGVGLAHCRRIIERHGGQISAFGEPGKGTTLRFTLPTD